MQRVFTRKTHMTSADDIRREYHFDYRKARPNRFAAGKDRLVVVLDPDLSKVFKTPEAVNAVLRALITTLPQTAKNRRA